MRDSNKLNSEIYLVCQDCGSKALKSPINKGKTQFSVSTWHEGRCDVCYKERAVTEARDFGYCIFPDFKGKPESAN